MNLQHQRIAELCQALKLERVADHYPVLAQQAVREEFTFGDFQEQLLRNEQSFRQQRSCELLTKGLFPGDQDAGGVRFRLQSRCAQDAAA